MKMKETLTAEVEAYLEQAEDAGYMASIVEYKRPVGISYLETNLLLFEGITAEITKSGRQQPGQYRPVDEYQIRTTASTLAVVTEYWKHTRMGFSSIQRMEKSGNGYKQVPTPSVCVLPSQEVPKEYREIGLPPEDGTFIKIASPNQLQSNDIGEVARNHTNLVYRLLALQQYNPKLLGTTPISVMDLDDIIPFSIT